LSGAGGKAKAEKNRKRKKAADPVRTGSTLLAAIMPAIIAGEK
jgi:hypothetical protein